jgi:hypothetical protein
MRYLLSCNKETYAFDSLEQLRYFLSTHIPRNRRKDWEPVDPLCLRQAADGVLLDTHCSCWQWAEHYNVPDEVVFAMVADLFIWERTGAEPLDTSLFVEFAERIIREEQSQNRACESFSDLLVSGRAGVEPAPAAHSTPESVKEL